MAATENPILISSFGWGHPKARSGGCPCRRCAGRCSAAILTCTRELMVLRATLAEVTAGLAAGGRRFPKPPKYHQHALTFVSAPPLAPEVDALSVVSRVRPGIDWSLLFGYLADASLSDLFDRAHGLDGNELCLTTPSNDEMRLLELALLVAIYLLSFESAVGAADVGIEWFMQRLRTKSANIQRSSLLPADTWEMALLNRNLRISDPRSDLTLSLNQRLEKIRLRSVNETIDRHLFESVLSSGAAEVVVDELMASLISTSYFTVVEYRSRVVEWNPHDPAAWILLKNLRVLGRFAETLPAFWATPDFVDGLRVAWKCLLNASKQPDVSDLDDDIFTISSITQVFSKLTGTSEINDVIAIDDAPPMFSDLNVQAVERGLLKYFSCQIFMLDNLQDIDKGALNSVSTLIRSLFAHLTQSGFEQHLKTLSPYLLACPSSALGSVVAAYMQMPSPATVEGFASRIDAVAQVFTTAFAARWASIDAAVLAFEHGRVARAVRWVAGLGGTDSPAVCSIPAWVQVVIQTLSEHTTGALASWGSVAIVTALLRVISNTSQNPCASWKLSAEIRNLFVSLVEGALLRVSVSYSETLNYSIAKALVYYKDIYGGDRRFERMILSSDSSLKALMSSVLDNWQKMRSNDVTETEISGALAAELSRLSSSTATAISVLASHLRVFEIDSALRAMNHSCANLALDWKRVGASLKDAKNAEATKYDTAVKMCLFSYVMIAGSIVDAAIDNNDLELETFWDSAVHQVLTGLLDLHFATCRFGIDAFPQWKQTFYDSLNYLMDGQSDGSCDSIIQIYLRHSQGKDAHFAKPRQLFVLLQIQHMMPLLTSEFIGSEVIPTIKPLLVYDSKRSDDDLDLFEMSHWLLYKIFDDAGSKFSRIVAKLSDWYSDLIIENFMNGDDLALVRRMLAALVKSLSTHEGYFRIEGSHVEDARDGVRRSSAFRNFGETVTRHSRRTGNTRHIDSKQSLTSIEDEVLDADELSGEALAWSCVEKIVRGVNILTTKISTTVETPSDDKTSPEGGPSNSRLEEILQAVPQMRYFIMRDGLLQMLFDQIRTVPWSRLEALLDIVRKLMLGDGDDMVAIGIEAVASVDESLLWKGLFEVVSGAQYYDQLRQPLCVDWYLALAAEARDAVVAGARRKTARVVGPAASEKAEGLRAKL
ncbi:hypothetical protein HDU83_003661 [Entophlyctis luteolus]|nr:hypothetical protein HDU83_003661 [Entophlyctis luteolus]